MKRWLRWVLGVSGTFVTLLGLAATWRLVLPMVGGAGQAVDGWMFEGPALMTFGILLLWTASAGGSADSDVAERGPAILLRLGLAFLATPFVAGAWSALSGAPLAEFAWVVTAFALGVPGIALTATGIALAAWRGSRKLGVQREGEVAGGRPAGATAPERDEPGS